MMRRPKPARLTRMPLVCVMTLLLAACATKPLMSTGPSTAAPVVNCDAAVADAPLDPVPAPPDLGRSVAYGVADPAALLDAYTQLYHYVSTALLPWAGHAATVVNANHALRQRTAQCLTTLRQQHVIN